MSKPNNEQVLMKTTKQIPNKEQVWITEDYQTNTKYHFLRQILTV